MSTLSGSRSLGGESQPGVTALLFTGPSHYGGRSIGVPLVCRSAACPVIGPRPFDGVRFSIFALAAADR